MRPYSISTAWLISRHARQRAASPRNCSGTHPERQPSRIWLSAIPPPTHHLHDRCTSDPVRAMLFNASEVAGAALCAVLPGANEVSERASSPGGCPPGPSQIRARRFPPLGSSAEAARETVFHSLRYLQKSRVHEFLGLSSRAWCPSEVHLNTGCLCSAGSGYHRPFPTFVARMQPSDSPARMGTPSGLPSVAPTSGASVGSVLPELLRPRSRPPDRSLPTARRSGSPVLRRPDPPAGRTGVSQVTGPSSSGVPQSSTPPVPLRLALTPPGVLLSRLPSP
jgi:hypothetical protein